MTKEERKEAIGVLENAKNFAYDEAYTKAFDCAIQSLKAWDKVINLISKADFDYGECVDYTNNIRYYVLHVINECLEKEQA